VQYSPPVTQEPEYAPTYSLEERVKYTLISLAIAGAVIFVCNFVLFPRLLMLINHVECQTVYGVSGVAVVMYMAFVGIPLAAAAATAPFILPLALGAIRTRQYPPPGRKVLRKVKIQRGPAAVRMGWFALSFVPFFLALAVWGSFQAASISRLAAGTQMDCVRVPEHPAPPAPRSPP
jgi:hypothetical protein